MMKMSFHEGVSIPVGNVLLEGELTIPGVSKGIVIFSHGSGSSRFSSRNRMVAQYLNKLDFGTLLFDLLTAEEDRNYQTRFNIELLTERLAGVTDWLETFPAAEEMGIGYFGASTGAASALKAAAIRPEIKAVVSRGGRPDLAMHELPIVTAPTLFIVGSLDYDVIKLNELAYKELQCEKSMEIVEGASHLFEEPGTMDEVCELAGQWFGKHLTSLTPSNNHFRDRSF
jgi:pimeloyl-ACP methyl ester carboxylesterase